MKFAVRRDGSPARFQALAGPVDLDTALAIRDAVESCAWVPGMDPEGRPASIWVILPLRFQSP